MGLFSITGQFIIDSVLGAGYTVILVGTALLFARNLLKRRRYFIEQLYITGVKPLPVIIVVGLFTGMILGLQMGVELDKFGQKNLIAEMRHMTRFMKAGSALYPEVSTGS